MCNEDEFKKNIDKFTWVQTNMKITWTMGNIRLNYHRARCIT